MGKKAAPHWLWQALDHRTGTVLAYVFGRREDQAFLELKALLEPFGIRWFFTDGWGAYRCVGARMPLLPLRMGFDRKPAPS